MQKLFFISFLLLSVVLIGCETERVIFTGPYFVRFTETSLSKKESDSKPIYIEVHMAGPALTEDVVVNYKISGNARENVDFTVVGDRGKVTIKKGEYFGTIEINLINNANNIIRSQDLILTLETVSTSKLKIGQGESGIGNQYTLTIIDDCILGGTYIGQRGSVQAPGISIISNDCENYLLSNWNINVFNTGSEMDLLFIDNGDNTLTIPEQEEENLSPTQATIRGTGVVDPLTRQIIMTITLVDFTNQPQVTIAYIPD
ncbi:MAG: hypothetical protein JNM57_11790 [Cyclobacteriaceae bacterium]|nr:hypothetical protein [Cyclobacteriaceae bacterium]